MANDWTGGNPFLGQNNPYLQQQIDSSLADTTRAFNLQTKPAIESSMVRSGSFGNSGLQQVQNEAQRGLMQTLGNQANNFRAQDYGNQQQMYQWDQGFNRSLFNDAYGQNMQNLQTGVGLLGQQQAYNQADQTSAGNIQNTPLNYWQQFSNGANSIGQGYGNSTVSGGGSSPLVSALGGAQLGSAFANSQGWGGGGGGAVSDGGYSSGTGSAYAGSTDNGMFTPFRRGM
jgi:hypothetical protein